MPARAGEAGTACSRTRDLKGRAQNNFVITDYWYVSISIEIRVEKE